MLILKLKRLSIESKMKLIALFPLIFIIGLSFFMVFDAYEKNIKQENVKELIVLNSKISLLLHETQKERGLSISYLESNNETFKKNLLAQRELTNNRINELKDFIKNFAHYPEQGKISIQNAVEEISKIENIRKEIDNLSIDNRKVISYYSSINSSLLSFVANSSFVGENENIINSITAYYNFLMAKERAGLERAIGSSAFINKTFINNTFITFLSLINEQNVF